MGIKDGLSQATLNLKEVKLASFFSARLFRYETLDSLPKFIFTRIPGHKFNRIRGRKQAQMPVKQDTTSLSIYLTL